MKKYKPARIKSSEITPEHTYLRRREFVQALGLGTAALASPALVTASKPGLPAELSPISPSPYSLADRQTPYEDVTEYNNFYEFGTGKGDPARNAGDFVTKPWTVRVSGEAEKTGDFNLEDILAPHPLEERIYRLRCVEAWSMVIPWVGIPLSAVLERFKPNSNAKYVAFKTLLDRDQMPGQRRRVLQWPYREGLRIDEAMHPLTILAVGLYGRELPNQNGAPLRLVVPWKYGYKSIKSIVEIEFTRREPRTSWNMSAPHEYGFYSNVNPNVDHPRWSQASERRIGEGYGIFNPRKPTLMFNGYADEVADLYQGMDLVKNH